MQAVRVVLVHVSGDIEIAKDAIWERFPRCEIKVLRRSECERESRSKMLMNLRRLRPDIFAVNPERLEWLRGQNAFLLFGSLAGANRSIIVDAHGGWREESRLQILARAAARFANEGISSASIRQRALRELANLEKQIVNHTALRSIRSRPEQANSQISLVYLRSTPGPGTQVGGAASHIKGVTDALVGLGAKLRFISNDAIAGLDADHLDIIKPELLGITRALCEIHSNHVFTQGAVPLIEQGLPDFVYQRYARFGWPGVVATLRTGRPLFLEYNGSEVWVGRNWDHVGMLDLLMGYERLNLAAATRIFVVSEVERRNLERSGIPPEKIIVNPNGVDTDKFRPGTGGQETRARLGIESGETLVGFVGSFGPWHGVIALANAIKAIPPTAPVKFLLIGNGSLHGQVQQLLQSEIHQKRVILTGAVDHRMVPALLDACNVLVSPHVPLADGSEFFGSPTKLFEYMAMGKGIVASQLGQIADVLRHDESALLVEPGNVRELSAAILQLAGSPELCDRLGSAARQAAIQKHTWKRNAQNVLDAYQGWLSETK